MNVRMRRLREQVQLRAMTRRVELHRSDFIVPLFVCAGSGEMREVGSMPGVFQMSVDVAADWLAARAREGFLAYLVFGVIEAGKKDAVGSAALDEDNVVCRLLRAGRELPMAAIADLCFCEYTSHGHCGVLGADGRSVDNDATVRRLAAQALNLARAGADVVAPSGKMDGAVAALRRELDGGGFGDMAILSYAVKYASAFYGPFREAADAAPQFGDRRGYQMDPARGAQEAVRAATADVDQGADMIMVKPAGPYLDVLAAVRQAVAAPLVGYQVSGEYAMLEAAARHGWIDRDKAVPEALLAIKRAGADMIVSYYAPWLAAHLPG